MIFTRTYHDILWPFLQNKGELRLDRILAGRKSLMQPHIGISHGQKLDLFTVSILISDGKTLMIWVKPLMIWGDDMGKLRSPYFPHEKKRWNRLKPQAMWRAPAGAAQQTPRRPCCSDGWGQFFGGTSVKEMAISPTTMGILPLKCWSNHQEQVGKIEDLAMTNWNLTNRNGDSTRGNIRDLINTLPNTWFTWRSIALILINEEFTSKSWEFTRGQFLVIGN